MVDFPHQILVQFIGMAPEKSRLVTMVTVRAPVVAAALEMVSLLEQINIAFSI